MNYNEIETQDGLKNAFKNFDSFTRVAFQNVDLKEAKNELLKYTFKDCIFLGCTFDDEIKKHIENSNFIFPQLRVPFRMYRSSLYDKDSLYGNYITGKPDSYQQTLDKTVYDHFIENGKIPKTIEESLARRLHDHSITDALYDFLSKYDEHKVVAIMGGHRLSRNDENYKAIVMLSKKLTEMGYLMISGGGPGAMEATHAGAWLSGYGNDDISEALAILSIAPYYNDENWLDKAFEVIEKFPRKNNLDSLGVPTWLYGHEPPTPFATKIAKYFANSVREDGLLTIAKGGIVFTPGSAGTIQEVFQEVTQNHYLSFGYSSPMIFYNKTHWINKQPIYPLLKEMQKNGILKNLILSVTDDESEIINELERFGASFQKN